MELKTKKFTLIELLVACAIIMVLFSLLVHSFVRAKEIARRIYCVNNLHQAATVANIYNSDHGRLPYSSNWLIDFTFLSDYIPSYQIMECPETEDKVSSSADLLGNTSYHYMGDRYEWLKNNETNGDGSEYGFDASNPSIASLLSQREEKVMYDKTDTVHYGFFNVAFLESSHIESYPQPKSGDFWFITESGTLNFPAEDAEDGDDDCVDDGGGDDGCGGGGDDCDEGGGGDDDDEECGGAGGGGDDGECGDGAGGDDDCGGGRDDECDEGGGGSDDGCDSGNDDDGDDEEGDHPSKVYVMHIPKGEPENAHIIYISWNGWENGHKGKHGGCYTCDANGNPVSY